MAASLSSAEMGHQLQLVGVRLLGVAMTARTRREPGRRLRRCGAARFAQHHMASLSLPPPSPRMSLLTGPVGGGVGDPGSSFPAPTRPHLLLRLAPHGPWPAAQGNPPVPPCQVSGKGSEDLQTIPRWPATCQRCHHYRRLLASCLTRSSHLSRQLLGQSPEKEGPLFWKLWFPCTPPTPNSPQSYTKGLCEGRDHTVVYLTNNCTH